MEKLKLKRDIIIQAGTIFDNCDGETIKYYSGNYMAILSLHDDSAGYFIINDDLIKLDPTIVEKI